MKKNRTVYSPYKRFILEGLEFKSDLRTYTVKLSNDLKHVTKMLNWQKDTFDFQAYYQDLNMIFVFNTKFYSSNTVYI